MIPPCNVNFIALAAAAKRLGRGKNENRAGQNSALLAKCREAMLHAKEAALQARKSL